VHATALVTGLADLAGVVGDHEGTDDEVADFHGHYLVTDLLDDADVLMAHRRVVDVLDAPVGPQVRPADTSRCEANDCIRRVDDLRVVTLPDAHVARGVHENLTHGFSLI
jgi:hypothetical protein